MGDLISKSALLEAVDKLKITYFLDMFGNYNPIKQATKIINCIEDAPTVEPPKGEWIEDTVCCENPFDPYKEDFMDVVICSKCGSYYGIENRSNFCPHCGADMRGNK